MYEQMLDGVNVMFNNKVKLFLVTLIFMLSISAVAAVENTTSSDDMLIGEVDEEPPSGVVQDISTDNNLEVTDNDDKSQIGTLYELKADNVKMYYKNGSSYDVTLLENFEPVKDASVSITINGVSYTKVTDKSGKISIPITLNSGSYVATAKYNDIQIKNTIKVLPVISASDVTTTYKSTAQYKAKFLDGQGMTKPANEPNRLTARPAGNAYGTKVSAYLPATRPDVRSFLSTVSLITAWDAAFLPSQSACGRELPAAGGC